MDLLHTGGLPSADLDAWRRAGASVLRIRPAGSDPAPDTLVDVDNTLWDHWRKNGVGAVAVRPDGIVR